MTRALSVRQPWTSLIACGRKTLEIRSWNTTHRGPLVVCASAAPDRIPLTLTDPLAEEARSFLRAGPCPLGVTVALVEIIDCRPFAPDDAHAACCAWEPNQFAWVIGNVHPIAPSPVKGRLGFFDVDVSLTPIPTPRRIP